MDKAYQFTQGGNIVIVFPANGQIGPETEKLLTLHKFQKTGSWYSNRYRKDFFMEDERIQLTKAARHICDMWNGGKKEYCRELLTRQRIKHG